MLNRNLDPQVVSGFGDEWEKFDQSALTQADHQQMFDDYFSIFPWANLPAKPIGIDIGCGSGRWAKLVAPRVGVLHCVDASEQALNVAKRNLSSISNCEFHHASVDAIPLDNESADFAYSLGVLHHIPDTQAGIRCSVAKLKRGAPLLIYLYFAFDNKPIWYRWLWQCSEIVRFTISRLPFPMRYLASQIIAATVYYPFARFAKMIESLEFTIDSFPLSYYRNRSFYVMRTDALDRFGTKLEKRFTRLEIEAMMKAAGLEKIIFSNHKPHWCAVGFKK